MKKKEDYFFVPTKLPAGEKAFYDRIRPIMDGLLEDLKINGCLRRATAPETAFLIKLMQDKDEHGLAFNRFQSIFLDKPTIDDFIKMNGKYFDGEDLSYLFISQLYFLSLVHVEMFRNVLLFYLKRGKRERFNDKMTLGKFFVKLKEVSPVNGELIKNELEPFIRNSFAHGLFAIENRIGEDPFLLCFKSIGELENPTRIPLAELLIKRKNLNIIYMTLADLIAEKMRKGTFR